MRRPLRILELRAADGAGGGPEKTIINGASLSDPNQFEVHVVYLKSEKDNCTELSQRAAELGIKYQEIRGNNPIDLRQFTKLKGFTAKHSFDIVHSHDYKSNFLALCLRRRFPFQILSTAHGWTGNTRRERFLYYPVERRLLCYFQQVISVSSEITSVLCDSGVSSHRIETIPNGINADAFVRDEAKRVHFRARHQIPNDSFVIAGVGRLERQKRFDLLIQAFARIRSRVTQPCFLLIAGEGSLRQDLQDQINQLHLAPNANLIGHVSDVGELYSGLDLFVQASDYEGTSNAVLEAMSMQVPIVATRAGGTCDIIDHGRHGLLTAVGNLDEIVQSMLSVFDHKDRAAIRCNAARARVENQLSFSARNRRLERLYEKLAGF